MYNRLNMKGKMMDDMDYISGYDDGEWDPVMGDGDEWIETDDEWLDDFQGEEDWG
jgi:hypothetical protein